MPIFMEITFVTSPVRNFIQIVRKMLKIRTNFHSHPKLSFSAPIFAQFTTSHEHTEIFCNELTQICLEVKVQK